jgi:hypothetical protein
MRANQESKAMNYLLLHGSGGERYRRLRRGAMVTSLCGVLEPSLDMDALGPEVHAELG